MVWFQGWIPTLSQFIVFSRAKTYLESEPKQKGKTEFFSAFQFSKDNQEGEDQGSGSDFNWYLDIGKSLPLSEP